MALSKKQVENAAFEAEDVTAGAAATVETKDVKKDEAAAVSAAPATAEATAEAPATAPAADDAPTEATGTAVVEKKDSPLALKTGVAAVMQKNVYSGFKDSFTIEHDSVPRIKAEQGEMVMATEDETSLGKHFTLDLLSYQEHWVATPGDNDADIEFVKYSDDGVTSNDGVNLLEHVKALKEVHNYTNAKIQHRFRVVGELISVDSTDPEALGLIGSLVQVDLPESGRRSFNSHALQASFKVAKGRAKVEDVARLKFTASKAKSTKNEVYTKTDVSAG